MPIHEVIERMPEIGRIRMGEVEHRGQRSYPKALETWRLTSTHSEAIARAAALWGGQVGEWSPERGGGHGYEVTLGTATLPVLVPPQDIAASQYLEAWSGGGIVRRCDGDTELISGGPCICARESDRSCLPTTRLRVVLPDLPGLGHWLLVSRGWSAASELRGSVAMIATLVGRGGAPAAELVLDRRTRISEGETKHFTVPTLRLPYALRDLAEQPDAALSQTIASGSSTGDDASSAGDSSAMGGRIEEGAPEEEGGQEPAADTAQDRSPSSRRRYPIAASDCLHTVGVDAEGRCVDCGKPLEVSR